jgi:hypothetical protein
MIFPMLVLKIYAQYEPGARQIAMANATVAWSDDLFTLYTNPAGLRRICGLSAAAFYSPSPFGMKELSNSAAIVAWQGNIVNIAAGYMRYGFDLYNESAFSMAFAVSPAYNFYSGLSVNYHHLKIQNYGTDGTVVINIGAQYFILNRLSAGFCIDNVTRASFGNSKDQVPVSIDAGMAFMPADGFTICAAAQKELKMPATIKAGAEWQIVRQFHFRYGVSAQPERYTAGAGIAYGIFRADYAVFTHPDLGLTHQFDIIINFDN